MSITLFNFYPTLFITLQWISLWKGFKNLIAIRENQVNLSLDQLLHISWFKMLENGLQCSLLQTFFFFLNYRSEVFIYIPVDWIKNNSFYQAPGEVLTFSIIVTPHPELR